MNKDLIKKWLHDFKNHPVEDWFAGKVVLQENYEEIQDFFNRIKQNEFKEKDSFLNAFSPILKKIFRTTNSTNSYEFLLGDESLDSYIKKIQYLLDEKEPVANRIDNALQKEEYKITRFSIITQFDARAFVCDLIAYNEPNKYTFNQLSRTYSAALPDKREKQVLQILDIESKIPTYKKYSTDSYGKHFETFNKVIREALLEDYSLIIYGKSSDELSQDELYSKTTLMLEIDEFINWILTEKEIGIIKNGLLDKIELENFYSIHEKLVFDDLKNKQFIFLLGENGTGKTVFLKALLISLKKDLIDKGLKEDFGFIDDILEANPYFNSDITFHQNNAIKNIDTVRISFTKREDNFRALEFKNVYAYGTQRNRISKTDSAEKYGFLTLFNENKYITNVNKWLIDLDHKALERSAGRKTDYYFPIKEFELILQDLLDIKNLTLDINSQQVIYKINGVSKEFKELSEGFQSVINLVTDLVARLIKNNPNIKSLKDLKATKGIVLIDELDLFLHPKWEKNICGRLHEKFPNFQFFITTHSPILIIGTLKDDRIKDKKAIKIFKLNYQNNQTVIEKTYMGDSIKDWNLTLLLNSQMFDDNYLENYSEEQIDDLKIEEGELTLEQNEKRKIILDKMETKLRERFKTVKL